MTLEEIAEARRVIAQASSPPWRRSEQGIECGTGSVREIGANLTFIVAARAGWPAALDEVEQLQKKLDEKAAEIERLKFALQLAHEQQEMATGEHDLRRGQLDAQRKSNHTTSERDPDFPCEGFDPRPPTLADMQDCETDGHYRCNECVHKQKGYDPIGGGGGSGRSDLPYGMGGGND